MFYEPRSGAPLPHDPFKAMVAPRPIGWISSISRGGVVNLAPYSYFNAICDRPPMVMISSSGMKDSATNIIETGTFVVNLVGRHQIEAMNTSSAPYPADVNEFEAAGLGMVASTLIAPPRVGGAPGALECRLTQHFALKGLDGRETANTILIAEVVGVHVEDVFLREGRFDTAAAGLVARCGYMDYAVADTLFALNRPQL